MSYPVPLLVTLGAAAFLTPTIAGCSSGASHPVYLDRLTCRTLASVTRFTAESGSFSMLGREQVLIQDHPKALSPAFRRDVLAVVSTGLNNPSQAAVQQLQADCQRYGVHSSVWPASLTGSG
jgi:hypothetical protein